MFKLKGGWEGGGGQVASEWVGGLMSEWVGGWVGWWMREFVDDCE